MALRHLLQCLPFLAQEYVPVKQIEFGFGSFQIVFCVSTLTCVSKHYYFLLKIGFPTFMSGVEVYCELASLEAESSSVMIRKWSLSSRHLKSIR